MDISGHAQQVGAEDRGRTIPLGREAGHYPQAAAAIIRPAWAFACPPAPLLPKAVHMPWAPSQGILQSALLVKQEPCWGNRRCDINDHFHTHSCRERTWPGGQPVFAEKRQKTQDMNTLNTPLGGVGVEITNDSEKSKVIQIIIQVASF